MESSRRLRCSAVIAIIAIIAFLTSEYIIAQACELDQAQHGCRIDNGACQCGYGCKSEYRYTSRRECMDALKGRAGDVCGRLPCSNGGDCIQISQSPGFRCRCDGTGYWGTRCQRQCPTSGDVRIPYECIII